MPNCSLKWNWWHILRKSNCPFKFKNRNVLLTHNSMLSHTQLILRETDRARTLFSSWQEQCRLFFTWHLPWMHMNGLDILSNLFPFENILILSSMIVDRLTFRDDIFVNLISSAFNRVFKPDLNKSIQRQLSCYF